jgi:NAD+ synthetase
VKILFCFFEIKRIKIVLLLVKKIIRSMIKNYSQAIANIRKELKNYLQKYRLKALILGVSGGIDSALSAALAAPVCKETGVQLICRSLTILTNKPEEILRARLTGEAFGTDFRETDLSAAFNSLMYSAIEDIHSENADSRDFKIRMGNLKARTRMMYLYDLASKEKGMVISTDNFTELLLGFWTLHGDVGDYCMLQYLWKTEVYAMARYLVVNELSGSAAEALRMCIDAVPTDGLGISNSDLDQIGASSYDEVDQILIRRLQNPEDTELEKHKVIQRNIKSEFKRNNPYNIPRHLITDEPAY